MLSPRPASGRGVGGEGLELQKPDMPLSFQHETPSSLYVQKRVFLQTIELRIQPQSNFTQQDGLRKPLRVVVNIYYRTQHRMRLCICLV